jgi:hypothetical protein
MVKTKVLSGLSTISFYAADLETATNVSTPYKLDSFLKIV